MPPYRIVLDADAVAAFGDQTARDRARLRDLFLQLASAPHQRGESTAKDHLGRTLQIKAFGRWHLTFWTDDPVHELRIVGVDRIALERAIRRRKA